VDGSNAPSVCGFSRKPIGHVRFEVDLERQTFSLYLDGSLSVTDAEFCNTASELAFLEFRSSVSGSGGTTYIDDLKIVSYD